MVSCPNRLCAFSESNTVKISKQSAWISSSKLFPLFLRVGRQDPGLDAECSSMVKSDDLATFWRGGSRFHTWIFVPLPFILASAQLVALDGIRKTEQSCLTSVTIPCPRRLSVSISGERTRPVLLENSHNEPTPLTLHPISAPLSNMNDSSSSTRFKSLFDAALLNYERQTGIRLADHPLAKQLETCESVESITAFFQEQVSSFRDFRDDGKIMNSLKSAVPVLHSLSTNSILSDCISVVCRHQSMDLWCSLSSDSHSHQQQQYLLASLFCLRYASFPVPPCVFLWFDLSLSGNQGS